MAELDGLMDLIPIGDIATRLGINEKDAKAAISTVLPTIVAGLSANASSTDGAASLEKALTKHGTKSTKLDDVDEEDGKKIVNHVFGAKKEAVTAAAAGSANVTQDIIAKVLPIVAPIVLAWLAQKFLGGGASSSTKSAAPAASSSGGIGDILGGLVGSKEGQDMLGGLLGGLLGGNK
jgi:hypothetical protein